MFRDIFVACGSCWAYSSLSRLIKRVTLICLCGCMYILSGYATADALSDAKRADKECDYPKAAKLYLPLAQQGNVEAQTKLGVIYDLGGGVRQDYKEAVKWFRLAAENGYAPAQSYLGGMYRAGRGVPEDYKEAVRWIRLSAENGYASAQADLGNMYKNGEGVAKDYVLAHMWLNIAASNDTEFPDLIIGERHFLESQMSANQIAKAQELANKCIAQKFKGC